MKTDLRARPKKHLGQNFLINKGIRERIIAACSLSPDEVVLEIGPGDGLLTREIVPRVKELIAVEKDRSLVKVLAQEFSQPSVKIVAGDILAFDFNQLAGRRVKVIGNLPYYISTPIITTLLENRQHLTDIYVTVQLEFGQRLAAAPHSKEFGALTLFVKYYAITEMLFTIKAANFKPRPKVDSCFLRITPRSAPAVTVQDEAWLFKIIRTSFTQRRKTILNALKPVLEKADLEKVLKVQGISPASRPEDLSLEEFAKLAGALRRE